MQLTTPRLLIRHLKPQDLDDFYLYRSNPDVTKYQSFDVMTRERATAFIDKQKDNRFGEPGQWVQYAIENLADGKLVGDCAMHLQTDDPRTAEIGITISHLHQKKGYAKETMLALLKFLFVEHNIHRVVEIVDAENEGSIALLKSIGFRQEGHFIENIFFKGKWGSEYQFAMLRSEWELRGF